MDERTSKAIPVLVALGVIWGASFLFIKVWVDESGPMELVAGRLLLGGLAVGGFMLATRRSVRITPALFLQVSVMAFISNLLPFGLIAWAEEHISSGNASVLNATVPISTAVVAAAVLDDEYLTPGRIGGLVLGFLGVGVLIGEDVLDITSADVIAQLAVVAAAGAYGIGAVYARQLLRGIDPVSFSLLQLALGAVYAIPITLAVTGGSPDFSVSTKAWACLAALGVGGTGVGYVMYLWLIENIGSVRASLVTYIVPAVAVVLGWIALDESIGVNTIAGGLLIVAGVASVMRGAAPIRSAAEPPLTETAPAAVGE